MLESENIVFRDKNKSEEEDESQAENKQLM